MVQPGPIVLTYAFHIHEVGAGTLHQPLLLVSSRLLCEDRVHQIRSQLQWRQQQDFTFPLRLLFSPHFVIERRSGDDFVQCFGYTLTPPSI